MRNKNEKPKRVSSSGSTKESNSSDKTRKAKSTKQGKFHLEFKNASQRMAWATFQQHDVLFLNGAAGTGKSFLAMAFAINEVLQGTKKKIILTFIYENTINFIHWHSSFSFNWTRKEV